MEVGVSQKKAQRILERELGVAYLFGWSILKWSGIKRDFRPNGITEKVTE